MEPTILDFDPKKYKFREWACEVLGATCLEKLHKSDRIKALNRSPTSNQLPQLFSEIDDTYHYFILE